MGQAINLDYGDCLMVMGASIARARKDVVGGTPAERSDAEQFLEDLFGAQWRELITITKNRRKAKRVQSS